MNFLLLNLLIALAITFVTTFFIGIFVLLKSKGNKTKIIFAFYSFSIAWWSFFQFMANNANTSQASGFWSNITMLGAWFIPALFLHFTISFLNIKNRKWVVYFGYILSLFFSIMMIYPSTSFDSAKITHRFFLKYWVTADVGGIVYHFATVFFFICTTYGLLKIFKAYNVSTSDKRNQLAYLFWASLVGYIGGSSNFLLVYNIYIPILHPFGTYFGGLYVFTIAYAIIKHHLMDIRVVVKKALVYSISIAFVSGIIVAVSLLSNWLSGKIPGFNFLIVPAIAGTSAFVIGKIFWNKSKEADKLKYEFITVAAHKLRTPLTEVKWGLDAARDKNISEEERLKLIEKIFISNERLIETTNEILNISKAEDKDYVYKTETVDLKEITFNILKNFKGEIKKKSIKLTTHFEKDLLKVLADKIRISSVIQILLENAILYTKDKIDIVIDSYEENILFHIEDNGIGISKEDQEYVFSKFYRSRGAYLSDTEGIGLGLHLAKNIIERHGGKIGVKSEGEGEGSVFWFELKSYS